MNGRDYMKTQMQMVKLGKMIQPLRIGEFLRAIANAETVAPVVDPTLFRKAQGNLTALKELAQALLVVQEKFALVQNAVIQTSMAYNVEKTEGKEL